MLVLVRKLLDKSADIINKLSRCVYQYPDEKRTMKWLLDNGDTKFRLDYDLDQNSVVFDLGGYNGQWASDMFSKYCCNILIFEPVEIFAQNIKDRFSNNPNIRVIQKGLSGADKVTGMSNSLDSSSMYKGHLVEDVTLVRAIDYFKKYNIHRIDLMKINIEGGEYDLLEHLIATNFIKNIVNLQIQFHDFVPKAEERMRNIQDDLGKTHKLTYQYEYVWENWLLK